LECFRIVIDADSADDSDANSEYGDTMAYPSDELPRLIVRLPADLKLWLEKRSRREAVSQNALVVQALRLAQDTRATGQAA